MEVALAKMAEVCPHVFQYVANNMSGPSEPPQPTEKPEWCKCGKCRNEAANEDRICCNNHPKNHENPIFTRICLDETTVELALINNCDWLNLPKIYTAAKFRNTAYRQYILWFYGKLGFKNRKRIPLCMKWAIRDRYPESTGNYIGFYEAY